MKKTLLILTILIFVSFLSQAQITGGSGSKTESTKTKKDKGIYKNYWNIYFQVAKPLGDFAAVPATYDDLRNGKVGMGLGFGLNVGQTFYLKNMDLSDIGLSDKYRFGIEASYLNLTFHFLSNSDLNWTQASFISTKVGPSLSYNPKGNWILSAKFLIEPTMYSINYGSEGGYSYDDPGGLNGFANKPMLRKSLGVYARNKPFVVGIDFSFGKGIASNTHDYYDNPTESLGSSVEVKTTRLDLIFGFSF